MAICEISNGKITASVDTIGAELKSLRKAESDLEYMWQGDPAYWNRTSPVLFPLVGGLKNGEYRTNGKTYKMGKHGFIRDKEFKLMSQESTELWLVLDSDESMKEVYPFDFKLEIGFRLEDWKLKVMWRVENPSGETIYFSIGGHPGFKCPMNLGEKRSDYFIGFDTKECVCSTAIGNDGLANENKVIYELTDGIIPFTTELFEKDAVVLEDNQVHSISILTPDKKPYVTVNFDTPVVLLWTLEDENAEFICIEPWCGLCDFTDFEGNWEDRKWGNKVEPGKRFTSGYEIIVD